MGEKGKRVTYEPLAKVILSVIPGEIRHPESFEIPGFRVALCLPGMTIFYCFRQFCKVLIFSAL
jgi:hypothetical protein